jgi:hypothetical protein
VFGLARNRCSFSPGLCNCASGGTTGEGELPADPRQRWRSLFVDEVEQATISMGAWETAENYTPISNGIAQLDLYVGPDSLA